jgi:hypothetical protein
VRTKPITYIHSRPGRADRDFCRERTPDRRPYVTATESSHLFGPGELRRFFTSRPTELQLNRRQRIRELLRLSQLMDAHSIDEFRDPTNPAHHELIDVLQPLAR